MFKQFNNKFENFLDKTKSGIDSAANKIQKFTKKVVDFIRNNIKLISLYSKIFAVIAVIVVIVLNIANEVQTYGKTPHYYVDKKAHSGIKSQSVYKQYSNLFADNTNAAAAAVTLSINVVNSKIVGNDPNLPVYDASLGLAYFNPIYEKPGQDLMTFYNVSSQIVDIINTKSGLISTWYDLDMYASCDLSVALAYWWSGVDIYFPACLGQVRFSETDLTPSGDGGQVSYLLGEMSKRGAPFGNWEEVPRDSEVMPGDIAIGTENDQGYVGHIWMYVANWVPGQGWIDNSIVQNKYPGSNANRYEGSSRQYYACLNYDPNPWNDTTLKIYRYIGPELKDHDLYNELTGVNP